MKKTRKTNIKRGEITQTPFSFRIDNELLWNLQQLNINKGRYINNAIKAALHKEGVI